jgi:hypothetical protein
MFFLSRQTQERVQERGASREAWWGKPRDASLALGSHCHDDGPKPRRMPIIELIPYIFIEMYP